MTTTTTTISYQEFPECSICFEEIKDNSNIISCYSMTCASVMCAECFAEMLDYANREGIYPTCPDKECEGEYCHIDFGHITAMTSKYKQQKDPPTVLSLFCKILWRHLTRTAADQIDNKLRSRKIIENISRKRIEYIRDNFPIAISKCASYAFKSKIQTANRNHVKRLEKATDKSNARSCFSAVCVGKLVSNDDNEIMKCDTCEIIYCMKCEKKKTSGHQCKQEDIETVKYMLNCTPCPKCQTLVERSEGCALMRCTRCGTNFIYGSGKAEGGGNPHNQQIDNYRETNRNLYTEYAKHLEEHDMEKKLLCKFEGLSHRFEKGESKDRHIDVLAKLREKYGEENLPTDNELEGLLRSYKKDKVKNYLRKLYYRIGSEIEDTYQSGGHAIDLITKGLKYFS